MVDILPNHVSGPDWLAWRPRAAELAEKPDAFFLEKAMESLSSIFSMSDGKLKKSLRDFRIFNWENEPWSRGAYSYSKLGFRSARFISRESIQNRIYFAGEAYYEGAHPGTVESGRCQWFGDSQTVAGRNEVEKLLFV